MIKLITLVYLQVSAAIWITMLRGFCLLLWHISEVDQVQIDYEFEPICFGLAIGAIGIEKIYDGVPKND